MSVASMAASLAGVVPLHVAVSGRARLKVVGLDRNTGVAQMLEHRLPGRSGIRAAAANIRTGNLLVHFDPARSVDTIIQAVAAMLDSGAADIGEPKPAPNVVPFPAGRKREDSGMPDAVPGDAPPHTLSREQVLQRLETQPEQGLSSSEAALRLARYGPNALPQMPRRSALEILLGQVNSLPSLLLLGSAALSVATGGLADAVVILAVVALNSAIGYRSESEAEHTIEALGRLVPAAPLVLRDGGVCEVASCDIVPGDMLKLVPGTLIACDARVIEAKDLTIDESALTGESMPSVKSATAIASAGTALGDRANMVFKGTAVTGGSGLAAATATAERTELGHIQSLVGDARPPETPMQHQLDIMGKQLVWLSLGACGLVFSLGLLRGFGMLQMLRSSVSLAVAAVPEGLPTVATVTLALGIRTMRTHNVLIRRLDAVETLGAVSTVCLDKTGTLTLNRMSAVAVANAREIFEIADGQIQRNHSGASASANDELRRLLETCVLCSEVEIAEDEDVSLKGSPTETALIELAVSAGIDVRQLRAQRPMLNMDRRTEQHRFMMTSHAGEDGCPFTAVKGSPDEVLQLCTAFFDGGAERPLDEEDVLRIQALNQAMAGRGLRVLGFATRQGDAQDPGAFSWLGLAGLADPTRPGMAALMRDFHDAGLRTIIITGDQGATAFAIARELDLSQGRPVEILEGVDLDKLDPGLLAGLAQRTHVFARVSPANKLQIVQALQRNGNIVAMTGDGINDGPALRAADIGVTMGQSGTDVAREVADVILEDDRLQSMLVALGQGRTIYANIRKAIHYLLATNSSEIFVMLGAVGLGLGQPLTPVQLLWINLVSDIFPALALGLEPPEPDVLKDPPRDPREPLITAEEFRRIGIEGAVLSAGGLAAYLYGAARYGAGPAAGGVAFITLAAGQLLHALSARSPRHTIFERNALPPNPRLNQAVWGLLGLQGLAALFPVARRLLGLDALGLADYAVAGAAAAGSLLVNETIKGARLRAQAADPDGGA